MPIKKILSITLPIVIILFVSLASNGFFQKQAITIAADANCNLKAGPCKVTLANGQSISFAIEPKSIPLVTPLNLKVETTGLDVDAVKVEFSGVDMNMGLNVATLNKSPAGAFEGNGFLPVCIRQSMRWQAAVALDTDKGQMLVTFPFETKKQ